MLGPANNRNEEQALNRNTIIGIVIAVIVVVLLAYFLWPRPATAPTTTTPAATTETPAAPADTAAPATP
jgi:heme/copper-type cytochrome/quinol oxidase subunit 2